MFVKDFAFVKAAVVELEEYYSQEQNQSLNTPQGRDLSSLLPHQNGTDIWWSFAVFVL